jgi:hypothetical protein
LRFLVTPTTLVQWHIINDFQNQEHLSLKIISYVMELLQNELVLMVEHSVNQSLVTTRMKVDNSIDGLRSRYFE